MPARKSSPPHRKVTRRRVEGELSRLHHHRHLSTSSFPLSLEEHFPFPLHSRDSQTCFTFLTGFINALHGLLNPLHTLPCTTPRESFQRDFHHLDRFCLPLPLSLIFPFKPLKGSGEEPLLCHTTSSSSSPVSSVFVAEKRESRGKQREKFTARLENTLSK